MARVQIAVRMLLVSSIPEMQFTHAWNTMAGTYAGSITITAITMGMSTFGCPDILSVGIENRPKNKRPSASRAIANPIMGTRKPSLASVLEEIGYVNYHSYGIHMLYMRYNKCF